MRRGTLSFLKYATNVPQPLVTRSRPATSAPWAVPSHSRMWPLTLTLHSPTIKAPAGAGHSLPSMALPLVGSYDGTGAAPARRVLTGTGCRCQVSSSGCVTPAVTPAVSPWLCPRASPGLGCCCGGGFVARSLSVPAQRWGNEGRFLLERLSVWEDF